MTNKPKTRNQAIKEGKAEVRKKGNKRPAAWIITDIDSSTVSVTAYSAYDRYPTIFKKYGPNQAVSHA